MYLNIYNVRFKEIFIISFCFFLFSCGGGSSSVEQPVAPVVPGPTTTPSQPSQTLIFEPSDLRLTTGDFAAVRLLLDGNDVEINDDVTVSCSSEARIDDTYFIAPFVQNEATVTCEATLSNGLSTVLTADIVPIASDRLGTLVGVYNPALELLYGNNSIGGMPISNAVFAKRDARSGDKKEFVIIGERAPSDEFVTYNYGRDDVKKFALSTRDFDDVFYTPLTSGPLPTPHLLVTSKTQDQVIWGFDRIVNGEVTDFLEASIIELPKPCAVASAYTQGSDDIIFGQENLGVSLVRLEYALDDASSVVISDTTLLSQAGDSRSLCNIIRSIPNSQATDEVIFSESEVGGFTAVDKKNNEIVFFFDTDADFVFEELSAIPLIEGSLPYDMHVMDVVQSDPIGLGGVNYFLIAVSDQNDIGDHRILLSYIANTPGNERFKGDGTLVVEEIYRWEEGVPLQLAHAQFGGSTKGGIFSLDLAVLLKDIGKVLYFDSQPGELDATNYPPYYNAAPSEVDVGFGATSMVAAGHPDKADLGYFDDVLLISYSDSGELRFFELNRD